MGWGDFGTVFAWITDWIGGKQENYKNKVDKLQNELERVMDEKPTIANRTRAESIVNELGVLRKKLENRK